jgi:hypothetical protein
MSDSEDSGGGILDWFTRPMELPDPSSELSPMGLLGAALQDFGAAQRGGQGSSLDNFAQRQRNAALYQRMNAMRRPPYGLQQIGAPGWEPGSPIIEA